VYQKIYYCIELSNTVSTLAIKNIVFGRYEKNGYGTQVMLLEKASQETYRDKGADCRAKIAHLAITEEEEMVVRGKREARVS
jgi:hypothetical protein